MKVKRVFLDTEFTTLNQGTSKLISLGMVCGQNQFYTEVDGWRHADCSEFTKAEVLPQLHNYQKPIESLGFWVRDFLSKQGPAVIATDSLTWDWMWLMKALPEGLPENIATHPLLLTMNYLVNYDLYEQLLKKQFGVWKQHHALNDAKAMQYAWEFSGGDVHEQT